MMYYVGIDVGGTGLKAGVVDEQGKILFQGHLPHPGGAGLRSPWSTTWRTWR